jgi:hypothetical protein
MKYILSVVGLLLAMSLQQPAFAQGSSNNLVKEAVTAEGGADALRGLKTLAIKAMPSSGSRGSPSLPMESRDSWEMRRSRSLGTLPRVRRARLGIAIRNTRTP